jgi:hypothetical protein
MTEYYKKYLKYKKKYIDLQTQIGGLDNTDIQEIKNATDNIKKALNTIEEKFKDSSLPLASPGEEPTTLYEILNTKSLENLDSFDLYTFGNAPAKKSQDDGALISEEDENEAYFKRMNELRELLIEDPYTYFETNKSSDNPFHNDAYEPNERDKRSESQEIITKIYTKFNKSFS